MLRLEPDSVSGGYAGGFDLASVGSHRQLSLVGWLWSGNGGNSFGPGSIWAEGVSGGDHFFVTLATDSAGDPTEQPCLFAELNLAAIGAVQLKLQSVVGSILLSHRYCIAATVDMDTRAIKMYLGDEQTPLAEVTVFAPGFPVTNLLLPYPTVGLGQQPFIDVQDAGFGQAYDRCMIVGRVLSLGELRDWQYFPRNLADSLGFFDPTCEGLVPTAGGFKSADGKGLLATSDIGAPQPTDWEVFPDASYHRLQAGVAG